MLTPGLQLNAKYFLASIAIKATRKIVKSGDKEFAPLGITTQQAMALRIIWVEGKISQSEFAEKMFISRPTALLFLKRLEDIGHISKGVNPHHAGMTEYKITKKGLKLIPLIQEKVVNLIDRIELQYGRSKLEKYVNDLIEVIGAEF